MKPSFCHALALSPGPFPHREGLRDEAIHTWTFQPEASLKKNIDTIVWKQRKQLSRTIDRRLSTPIYKYGHRDEFTNCTQPSRFTLVHFPLTSKGLSALASAPFSSWREKMTANIGSPSVCSWVGMYASLAPLSSLERLAEGAASILLKSFDWSKTNHPMQTQRETVNGWMGGEPVTWLVMQYKGGVAFNGNRLTVNHMHMHNAIMHRRKSYIYQSPRQKQNWNFFL